MGSKGKGGWKQTNYPQPSIVKIYNKFMGGTDKNDQYISYIRPNLKSMSWIPRVFTHFITIAAVNAYIIYSHLKVPEEKRKYYGIRDFALELAKELVKDDEEPPLTSSSTSSNKRKRDQFWNSDEGKTKRTCGGLNHVPRIMEHGHKKKEDFYDQKTGDFCHRYRNCKRSHCRFCYKSSITTMCSHCDIYLCLQSKEGEQNCWEKWHGGNEVGTLGSD